MNGEFRPYIGTMPDGNKLRVKVPIFRCFFASLLN